MRDSVVEVLPPAVNIFATDADEGERVAPLRFTDRTKLNGNGGIAIRVAFDGPFKAEVEERRMFDVKATGFCCVLGLERRSKERESEDQAPDRKSYWELFRRQKALLRSSAHGLRANIPEASGAVQRSSHRCEHKNSDLLPNVGRSMLAPGSITKRKTKPDS